LKAKYETIFNRIKDDKSRPLLNTQDSYSTGLKLFESRKAIYESFHFQVDTDNLLPEDVVKEILKIYKHAQR
jgi:shikimate kinase